jgi:hypothetical protein
MIGVTLGSGLAYMIGGSVIQFVQGLGTLTVPLLGDAWWPFFVGLPGIFVALLMARCGAAAPGRLPSAGRPATCAVVAYVLARRRAYGAHRRHPIFVMVVYGNLWPTPHPHLQYSGVDAGWTFRLIMVAGTLSYSSRAGSQMWAARGCLRGSSSAA